MSVLYPLCVYNLFNLCLSSECIGAMEMLWHISSHGWLDGIPWSDKRRVIGTFPRLLLLPLEHSAFVFHFTVCPGLQGAAGVTLAICAPFLALCMCRCACACACVCSLFILTEGARVGLRGDWGLVKGGQTWLCSRLLQTPRTGCLKCSRDRGGEPDLSAWFRENMCVWEDANNFFVWSLLTPLWLHSLISQSSGRSFKHQ